MKNSNITENVNLHNENYVDYYAQEFLRLLGAKGVTLTPRTVDYDGEKVVLLHIDGMAADSSRLNVDYWPKWSASEDDLKALPVVFDDAIFRIGVHSEKVAKDVVDPDTGLIERKVVTEYHYSKPRFVSYFNNGKEVRFHGKQSQFDETLGRSVWLEPETEEKAEEKPAEPEQASASADEKGE